jgi:Zn-dependent alcohol dehydrogenase
MRAKAAVLYGAGQPAVIEEITLDPPRQSRCLSYSATKEQVS